MTLVEYGSYACPRCHASTRSSRGCAAGSGTGCGTCSGTCPSPAARTPIRAAELAEYAAETTGRFWEVHEALMERGPAFAEGDFEQIARELRPAAGDAAHEPAFARGAGARARGRRERAAQRRAGDADLLHQRPPLYRPWDESSLADAMLGSLGHRIQSAAFEFVRWGPSSGLLLALATVLALVLSNSPLRSAFQAVVGHDRWDYSGATSTLALSLLDWVNHGLLTIFFFVVGLEIKREFTVGHLASVRSGALPVIAALGGIILPAVIYASIAPPELRHGWGIPIGTDTAFAVALIVLLGARVPVELRVFLTAAVIIDDIVAILVIALFYTGEIHARYLIAGGVVTALLVGAQSRRRLPPAAVRGLRRRPLVPPPRGRDCTPRWRA